MQTYKDATSQPGGSSGLHAAAARQLREEIEATNETIAQLEPPSVLAQPHADYLAGLELERAALGDMLEFYNSFSISLANRATLRLEDAGKRFDRARTRFDTYRTQAATHALAPSRPSGDKMTRVAFYPQYILNTRTQRLSERSYSASAEVAHLSGRFFAVRAKNDYK